MGINRNRITFLSHYKRDIMVYISGSLINSFRRNNNRSNISIGLVKNGNTSQIFGLITLNVPSINDRNQFGTTIYLKNVNQNDYFELFCKSDTAGDEVKIIDLQWLTEAK